MAMVSIPWNLFSSEDPLFAIDAVPDESEQHRLMRHLWDANAQHNPLVACDFFCGGFEAQFERNGERIAEFLSAQLALTPGQRLLDLGAGCGRIARYLGRGAAGYTLAEISPRLLDLARLRLGIRPPFCFHLLDDARLPWPDASFDACLAIDLAIHLPAAVLRTYLSELGRVLTPGGRCLLTSGVPVQTQAVDLSASRALLRLLNLRPVPIGSRVGTIFDEQIATGSLRLREQGNDFPNQLPVLGLQAPFAGNWLLFEKPG